MKFPVPKTLVGAYSPSILINWTFGIGVIEYPMGRPRRIISAFWALVNFTSYLGFVQMVNFPKFVEIQEFKIEANNYSTTAYFCVGFVGVSLCLGQARAKITSSSLFEIVSLNDRLETLGIPNDYDELLKDQVLQLCAGYTMIFTIVVLDFKYVAFIFHSQISRFGFFMTYHYLLAFSFAIYYNITSGVRIIHRALCKTAMEMNRGFGIQVLFSVTLSFGLITSVLYSTYTVIAMVSLADLVFGEWMICLINLSWMTFYAMKVLLIVQACEKTSCEANRTGRLITKLLDTSACDEDMRDEINIFSLQLIQNPLSYSASGFLTLDYALISGMIGTITTYLVIMIQMQSIYPPEIANPTPSSTM